MSEEIKLRTESDLADWACHLRGVERKDSQDHTFHVGNGLYAKWTNGDRTWDGAGVEWRFKIQLPFENAHVEVDIWVAPAEEVIIGPFRGTMSQALAWFEKEKAKASHPLKIVLSDNDESENVS